MISVDFQSAPIITGEDTLPLRWLCQLPLCGLADRKFFRKAIPFSELKLYNSASDKSKLLNFLLFSQPVYKNYSFRKFKDFEDCLFLQSMDDEIKKSNRKRAEIRALKSFRDRLFWRMEVDILNGRK
ncbi:MAG: hypothetical protein HFI47_06400 [Lachnospiraceae bacterium]|nr:hypothetical protein [Lachnospiraceae bacterium]